MAFAEGPHKLGGTFRDWVLKAMADGGRCMEKEELFQRICDSTMAKDHTYVAEYCGPSNRIVKQYAYDEIVMLTIRNNRTGAEVIDQCDMYVEALKAKGMRIRMPKVYDCASEIEMRAAMEKLDSLDEGFVVRDRKIGVRVKVKSPSYLVYHHNLRGGIALTQARIAEIVVIDRGG